MAQTPKDNAEALATAGSSEQDIERAALGLAGKPDLSGAVVAGSQTAADTVTAINKPLIGAANPPAQTATQLSQRLDGLDLGVAAKPFPTPQ